MHATNARLDERGRATRPLGKRSMPPPTVLWGVVIGAAQAASPLAIWWVPSGTVYAFGLAVIASVYIGFAVADGRTRVQLVELGLAAAFLVVAATAVTGSAWIVVGGLAAHGLKDLWQHKSQFVRHTRWWPSFCATVDFVAAAIIAVTILAGMAM